MLAQIEGYLLIPHELLHLTGYRLVRKQCLYQWGNNHVTPIGPMTRTERLVGLLFPLTFCIFWGLVLLGLSSLETLFELVWGYTFLGLSTLCFLYASTAIGDLRQAYLLLSKKGSKNETPFDFIFLPLTGNHTTLRVSAVIIACLCLVLIYLTSA